MSRSNLCDVEKGRWIGSPEKAAKIAKILGYSTTQFVACALEEQLHKMGLHLKVELKAA